MLLLVPKVASQLLFQDSKQSMTARADKERDMLEPNTSEMQPPKGKPKRVGKYAAAGSGGFGGGAAGGSKKGSKKDSKKGKKKGTGAAAGGAVGRKPADLLRLQTLEEDGVCLVPGVLGPEMAATLRETVADELSRAYAAVEDDPEASVPRFYVPWTTFDKLRGHLQPPPPS